MPIQDSILALPSQQKIYFAKFLPETGSKGLIVFVHGLGEHIRRYDEQFAYFNKQGFVVFAADLVGHGRTEGRRGVWSSMEENYKIIDLVFTKAKEDFPLHPILLYGHSMGGNIAARFTVLKKPNIKGLVLTGPAIKTPKDLPQLLVSIVLSSPQWLQRIDIANGLDLNSLCTDETVVQKYLADPLIHNRISIGAGATIFDNANNLLKEDWKPTMPVLMMHGGKDKITLPSGTAALSNKWNGQVEYKIWPDMLHEIHNEKNKVQVWDYILDWINRLF